jgi:hypothetical protein
MIPGLQPSILIPSLLLLDRPACAATGGPAPSLPGAEVYFIGLKDGDTIPTKSTIHFGLSSMGVVPDGSDPANSGHHHLIVARCAANSQGPISFALCAAGPSINEE